MAKKGQKDKKAAGPVEGAQGARNDSPSYEAVGTRAIRLAHARGVPICLDEWTSFGGVAESPTQIAIQEWSATKRVWAVIEVIRPNTVSPERFPPLNPRNFEGKYDRERVLTVFKKAKAENS